MTPRVWVAPPLLADATYTMGVWFAVAVVCAVVWLVWR
jgi:hypothetical protein